MTDVEERRDPRKQRVAVSTLVEICGNDPGIRSFEAESVNVSPGGMQLRTAYLPDEGVPLVCRFENEGREILVEGKVAWRREQGRSGEFGVMFTALDSRSVDALKALCISEPDPAEVDHNGAPVPGSRVRLHIEGLGSPMKARVQDGTERKVKVGSNLEFLKVGRRLEVEDVEQGARREAHIDSVSVVLDPTTRIPQLVVHLRYQGFEEITPSPSTSEVAAEPEPVRGLRIPAEAVTTEPASTPDAAGAAPRASSEPEPSFAHDPAEADPADHAHESIEDDSPAMRGRVATLAARAGERAKVAGDHLGRFSADAAEGALGWLRGAGSQVLSIARRRGGSNAPRRVTAPAPQGPMSVARTLRPQSRASRVGLDKPSLSRGTLKRAAIGAGILTVAAGGGFLAFRDGRGEPPGDSATQTAEAVSNVAPPAQPAAAPPAEPGATGAVTAAVPLFGPTPLATLEPAPLGPPPGSPMAEDEDLEKAEAKASVAAGVEDQTFADAPKKSAPPAKAKVARQAVRPEDVRPWGRGRLNLPTIHRLRLDAPGAALEGTVQPAGFSVVVPDRKVMEGAAGIAKRDPRVVRARATNVGSGAQITLQFKGEVPPYRVRLRRDYVEFLISAPEKKK